MEQLRNVETISKASSSLLTMVNDVLDIAKIESGTFVLEPETFLINDMLAETFVQMQPLATKKGLELKIYNAVPEDQALFGDSFRLSRTIINIISNAIKYTRQGFVEITTKLEPIDDKNMMFICRVKDTGIGMSEYMMSHVFDKFTQANETSTREFQGTGLGLHITKNILDLMKGKITVDSAVDIGSIFEIEIPLPVSEKPAQQSNDTDHRKLINPALNTKPLGIPFTQASILIAEDHEMNRTLITKLLGKWNNENFHFVENGQECLEELKRNPNTYDIIFMDCHMPIMDGWETTTHIRDQYDQHIPIIALTADAMPHTKATCFAKGMNAYISKPIHMATLEKILEEWFFFENTQNKKQTQDYDTNKNNDKPPVVDLTTLREYIGDNEDDISELLGIFYNSFSSDLANLTKETTEGKNEAWSEIAHKLKGSAAQVGAQSLRELCAEAQTMIKATEEERKKLLSDIEARFEDVCKDLDRQNYKYVSG